MSLAERKIENARSAAARLEQLGEHLHAEAVKSLCRSNSALVESLRRLRMDLEQQGASQRRVFPPKSDDCESGGGSGQ